MNVFTIRDIENLCGIKAHTLRSWEQRYRLISPKRKAGNHRLYDNEDLKYLLRIACLYHRGYKISQLAPLTAEEIGRLVLKIPRADDGNEIFINHLVEASLDFDQTGFDRVLQEVALHMGFETAMSRVLYPFFTKIGMLWLTGNVVPAQEHFASALILRKLAVAINGLENRLSATPGDRRVLLFTPQREFHEIHLLFMRYLLKKNGQAAIYFGHNVPLEAIRYYCDRQPVTHLYFHFVTNLLRCEPDQYLQRISKTFPDQQIVVSGRVGLSLHEHHKRLRMLKTPEDMEAFARGE